MRGLPFQFEVPVTFFEKAGEEPGKRRRIGGIISTEAPDRQNETVLADALVLDDFLKAGWFNDNHSRDTDGIVGYPEATRKFKKGEQLPNGEKAKHAGHWAEGYMLGTERANKIWELGKALQGTGRRLGFSVEGKILARTGPKTIVKKGDDGQPQWVGERIAKAVVRNVAITNCPVNTDTGLEILTKSLEAFKHTDPDDLEARVKVLEKMMAMGHPIPGHKFNGPQSGEGAGQVLAPQSLEHDFDPRKEMSKGTMLAQPAPSAPGVQSTGLRHIKPPSIPKPARNPGRQSSPGQPADPAARAMSSGKRSFKGKVTTGSQEAHGIGPSKGLNKSLTDAQAVAWVMRAIPFASAASAERVVELTKQLKRNGQL